MSVTPSADREEVARVIANYDLVAVPVVSESGHAMGVITVDDVIDAIQEEQTEDVQKFGGMEALDEPYMQIGLLAMIKKRAGWLSMLLVSEMLTTTVMQHFEHELKQVDALTLFVPLVMSSGGNSGSQATSLITRAMALREVDLSDWWRVARRELPSGLMLGAILGVIGMCRIALWQWMFDHHIWLGYDYNPHWQLIALTVGSVAGRHRDVRVARRIDAAVLVADGWVRSRERVGAVRRDARGFHGVEHLLPRGVAALARSLL